MGIAMAWRLVTLAAVAASLHGCTIESYDPSQVHGVLADFTVTLTSEAMPAAGGCILLRTGEAGYGVDDNDKADHIVVAAPAGARIRHAVRFSEITKYDQTGGLPVDDAFWCGAESNAGARRASGFFGFDCTRVVGPSPAARLESIDLIDPHWDDKSQRIYATGYTMTFVVQHPGVVRTSLACGTDVTTVLPASHEGDQVAELTIASP